MEGMNGICIALRIKWKGYTAYYSFFNFLSSFHPTTNITMWVTGMKGLTIPYKYRNTKWPRNHSQGEVYELSVCKCQLHLKHRTLITQNLTLCFPFGIMIPFPQTKLHFTKWLHFAKDPLLTAVPGLGLPHTGDFVYRKPHWGQRRFESQIWESYFC